MVILKDFYQDTKNSSFYYVGDFFNCLKCNKILDECFILNIEWSKKKDPKFTTFCFNCVKNLSSISEIEQRVPFFCSLKNDRSWEQFIPDIPDLVNGTPSTKSRNIDKTKLSGRPNATFDISDKEKRERISISEFQSDKAKLESEERVKELDNEADISYLDTLGKAEVLEYDSDEVKKLE